MFTPPPSPLPSSNTTTTTHSHLSTSPSSSLLSVPSRSPSPSPSPSPPISPLKLRPVPLQSPPQDTKKKVGRRTTWTLFLVPAVLILITLTTRYISHPVAFDALSSNPPTDWRTWSNTLTDWKVHHHQHKRDPAVASSPGMTGAPASSAGIAFPSSSPTPTTTGTGTATGTSGVGAVPTIPAAPPVLPTPFPQPFDTSLSENFSTQSCNAFFLNMTQTAAFRTCRPFSLLSQSSAAFLTAQTNLTALNTIVWGTCNTNADTAQCSANMAWFAKALQDVCSVDLGDRVSLAVNALIGLQAFDLLRTAGCLADPSANTYCYIDAVRNTNPSDLYFYSLPLGISLPNTSVPTCSSCTKSLMGLYAQQLGNLSELQDTYKGAAQIAAKACGTGFVENVTSGAVAREYLGWSALVGLVCLMGLMAFS